MYKPVLSLTHGHRCVQKEQSEVSIEQKSVIDRDGFESYEEWEKSQPDVFYAK
jgi:hypothetical protein